MDYTFGVSGKLYRNGLIMYDHQTGSLWSHVTGDAIVGDMRGAKLELVPVMHIEWGVWKELHPDTLVLRGPYGFYSSDPYEGYYSSVQIGARHSDEHRIGILEGTIPEVIGESLSDARLHPKEYVIGLRIDGKTKAYPFSVLSREVVVNDSFQNVPIVVAFDSDSAAGIVLDRRLNNLTLTFDAVDDTSSIGPVLVDKETGSRWLALSGEAIDGDLKGKVLRQVETTHAFWFGWKGHYPDTEVYQ